MIKRRIKQFTFVLLIIVVAFVWLLKQISLNEYQQHFEQQSATHSTLISSVNLLLVKHDVTSRQGLAGFLQSLASQPDIAAWELLDENSQQLGIKQLSTTQDVFYYTLYFKGTDARLLTLKLAFINPVYTAAIIDLELVAAILFAGVILLLGVNRFKWLFTIETYAQYILTQQNKLSPKSLIKSSNPICQAINQLILTNTMLVKDKFDLTEQIRKISYIDDVTELGNQLFFKAEFEVRLHNHEEAESGLLMLVSFVTDHDEVIDDDCLRAIANLLKQFVATTPNALVARLKNNDFALLLPNQTKKATDKLCKSLVKQLDKSIFDNTPVKEHFIDIGISAYKQGFDYYKILSEADMALRNSQLLGGNSWFMFGEALPNHKVRGSLKWRSFLERVLDKRRVQLYGQQLFYFDGSDKKNQEVFARIEDGKEILTAETFLPMADQCGLASEFDRQVIDGVIKHCLYSEKHSQDMTYSMNLFVSSLLDERFVSWLVGKLSSYPELCRHLYFEVKEAQVNQHFNQLRKVFEQVSLTGVHWSIKRFGSPDENLSYLDILPISRVKIDRRIINNIASEKSQQLLLNTLLINLQSRHIEVFADGVEKKSDADYIQSSGVIAAQGYYYHQPKQLEVLENFLKAV